MTSLFDCTLAVFSVDILNYRQQVNSTRGSPGSADNHGEHKVRGGKLAIDQTPDSYVGRGPGDNYSAHVDRFRLR